MKSLHKKISAVILALVLLLPALSQVFVAHANLDVKKVKLSSMEEFENYRYVLACEDSYKYDSLYLGSSKEFGSFKDLSRSEEFYNSLYLGIKEEYNYEYGKNCKHKCIPMKYGRPSIVRCVPIEEYRNGQEFVNGLKKRVLDKYRRRYEFIVVKVGSSYFQIFLKLSNYQRQRVMMELLAKYYKFKIICSNLIDNWAGPSEMKLSIMNILGSNSEEVKKLLEKPKKEYRFRDVQDFASRLELNQFKLKPGYWRYSIGNYDYVLYYEGN